MRPRRTQLINAAVTAKKEKKKMNTTAHMMWQTFTATAKIALVVGVIAAPLFAVQQVNAGTATLIGEAQTMSNGAGLVLLFGLQRS